MGPPDMREQIGGFAEHFGYLSQAPPGQAKWRVDISAYEAKNNPDGGEVTATPRLLR